ERFDRGSAVLSVLVVLLILIVLSDFLVKTFCFGVNVVGSSMNDTVKNGDFLYAVEREAQPGDIVIIDVREHKDEANGHNITLSGDYIIKRLIAVEGDEVTCRNGCVSVRRAGTAEFVPLDEDYAKGKTSDFAVVTVGAGEIFFLGDNRGNSTDSRVLGCYRKEDVIGVVPEWAIAIKGITTAWEEAHLFLIGLFKT
ncbi:MAG: signal peptidase I, partial [Candidatus Gallimonas sp.]